MKDFLSLEIVADDSDINSEHDSNINIDTSIKRAGELLGASVKHSPKMYKILKIASVYADAHLGMYDVEDADEEVEAMLDEVDTTTSLTDLIGEV